MSAFWRSNFGKPLHCMTTVVSALTRSLVWFSRQTERITSRGFLTQNQTLVIFMDSCQSGRIQTGSTATE
jgi:hypothetical protein